MGQGMDVEGCIDTEYNFYLNYENLALSVYFSRNNIEFLNKKIYSVYQDQGSRINGTS